MQEHQPPRDRKPDPQPTKPLRPLLEWIEHLRQHGRLDPMVPVQQSIDFAKVIEERAGAGTFELDIIEGAGHGGPEFESSENMERVFAFLDRYLK
jgi:hypothetical protein